MSNNEYQRRVVCAANRDRSGAVIVGARHWDMRMHEQYKIWELSQESFVKGDRFKEQGFIDQHGMFMTREEAWKVAEAAEQIIRRVGGDDRNGGTLYSENLY